MDLYHHLSRCFKRYLLIKAALIWLLILTKASLTNEFYCFVFFGFVMNVLTLLLLDSEKDKEVDV